MEWHYTRVLCVPGSTRGERFLFFFFFKNSKKEKKRETMSSRVYPSNHPLSPQGIPPTRVLAGHPSRTLAVDGAAWSKTADQAARPAVSRPRKAWDATNTDLSRYSLTLEERMRRKALLRSPVDTGNHRARRGRGKKKTKRADAGKASTERGGQPSAAAG